MPGTRTNRPPVSTRRNPNDSEPVVISDNQSDNQSDDEIPLDSDSSESPAPPSGDVWTVRGDKSQIPLDLPQYTGVEAIDELGRKQRADALKEDESKSKMNTEESDGETEPPLN